MEEAVRGLNTYRESSEDDSLKLLYKAEDYQRQQNDIDQRLLVITRSTTSDDAAVVFSKSVEGLQRLDVATAYIKMLHEVDRLRYTPPMQNLSQQTPMTYCVAH